MNSSATRDAANLLPPLFRSEADYGKFRVAVVQRSAQEQNLASDPLPLCQPGDGLVHHRLIDAGGHVGVLGPLVEQRVPPVWDWRRAPE